MDGKGHLIRALARLAPPPVPPEMMSWRARAYLAVIAMRHFAVAWICVFSPVSFGGTTYEQVRGTMSLRVWGGVFSFIGVLAVVALWRGGEALARYCLVMSAVISSIWAAGLYVAWIQGDLSAKPLPILWTALVMIDLIVASEPLRTPFEPLVRKFDG
jgi:hypothetical protein